MLLYTPPAISRLHEGLWPTVATSPTKLASQQKYPKLVKKTPSGFETKYDFQV